MTITNPRKRRYHTAAIKKAGDYSWYWSVPEGSDEVIEVKDLSKSRQPFDELVLTVKRVTIEDETINVAEYDDKVYQVFGGIRGPLFIDIHSPLPEEASITASRKVALDALNIALGDPSSAIQDPRAESSETNDRAPWAGKGTEPENVRYGAETKHPDFEEIMKKQPKAPGQAGGDNPFICTRCGEAMAANRIGFIDREGLPVHDACGDAGEMDEYRHANNGEGYKLNPKYFPAWKKLAAADDMCEACGKNVANRECAHGILCNKCDKEVHGKKGGPCKVGSDSSMYHPTVVRKNGPVTVIQFGHASTCVIDAAAMQQIKGLEPESGEAHFRDEQGIEWKVTLQDSGDYQFKASGPHGGHGSVPMGKLGYISPSLNTFAPSAPLRGFDKMPSRYSDEPWKFDRKRRERKPVPSAVEAPGLTQPMVETTSAEPAAIDFHETPTKLPPRDDMRRHLNEEVKKEIEQDIDGDIKTSAPIVEPPRFKRQPRTPAGIEPARESKKPSSYEYDPRMLNRSLPIAEDPMSAPAWVTGSRKKKADEYEVVPTTDPCFNRKQPVHPDDPKYRGEERVQEESSYVHDPDMLSQITHFGGRRVTAANISEVWDTLTPKGRCSLLGVKGKPSSVLFFTPWAELGREKELILSWIHGKQNQTKVATDNWLDYVSEMEEEAKEHFMKSPDMLDMARMEGIDMEQLWAEEKEEFLRTYCDPMP
jgi:hypothetical protein